MEMTPDGGALKMSQVLRNPLKTLVPVNASRNRVVDKQMELLVFSWRRRQNGRALLPPMTHPGPATKPSSGPPCSSEPLPWLNVGSNSLMPFFTVVKPTCGYRFSRETDHKRRHIGIPASNPVMWRSC
ncbi:unnamed protein product [Oncorhynchus mykiss]|uniref:Uncharacterized protein n=1 Tax=Oncorhynchus mykiss TaxID=8022 RepID=A0A060W957_ONCMY|nr:unnamed protein product [Oncorhynchus mykiss]